MLLKVGLVIILGGISALAVILYCWGDDIENDAVQRKLKANRKKLEDLYANNSNKNRN